MAKKTLKKKLKKKTVKKTDAARASIDQLTGPVLDSAQDIWRAGLGALAMAQREGGKVVSQGSALFEQLVAEGARVEKEGRAVVDKGAETLRQGVEEAEKQLEAQLESARQTVEDRWDHLEAVFEQRVLKVVKGMGLATAEELRRLADEVEALSAGAGPGGSPSRGERPTAKTTSGAAQGAGRRVLHLLPDEGDWVLRAEGEDRALARHGTKKEGLKAARELAQSSAPSRLVIHRADGTVQDQVSYDRNV
ncbi:MAG: phasin family protein [Xanthomonadales bacterium]|jgi:poly(hydroxyalkanoate) granule-associated protein|nr:phasin family protein [Xanthomonadales bacterium]